MMQCKNIRWLLAAWGFMLLQGELLLEEAFDYPAQHQTRLASIQGTPWRGGTGILLFEPQSMTFSNPSYHATTPQGGSVWSGDGIRGQQRGMSRRLPVPDAGEIWISLLHRREMGLPGTHTVFALGPAQLSEPGTPNAWFTGGSWELATSFGLVHHQGELRGFAVRGPAGMHQQNWANRQTVGQRALPAGRVLLLLVRGNLQTGRLDLWVFGESDPLPLSVADLPAPDVLLPEGSLRNAEAFLMGVAGQVGRDTRTDAIRVGQGGGDTGLRAVLGHAASAGSREDAAPAAGRTRVLRSLRVPFNALVIEVPLDRPGTPHPEITLDFATVPGTAEAHVHFVPSQNQLLWTADDHERKIIRLLPMDNPQARGRYFSLKLQLSAGNQMLGEPLWVRIEFD